MNRKNLRLIPAGWQNRPVLAYLLQLLIPGLGHMFVREYAFGLFVLLVMLLAAVLAVAIFFIEINRWGATLLMSVPIVFYLFTFADLRKYAAKTSGKSLSARRASLFLATAIAYQCLSPTSPLTLWSQNHPVILIADESYAPPSIRKGDWLIADRTAYTIDLSYLPNPLIHHVPDRYEFVYFDGKTDRREIGLVLGFPREQIEISDSSLFIDGVPDFNLPPRGAELTGEWPLTIVEDGSMLIATLHLGRIDRLEMVPVTDLIGRIRPFPH